MNTNKKSAPRDKPQPAEDRWLYDDPGNEDPGSQLDGPVPLRPRPEKPAAPVDVEPQQDALQRRR
ncbi:hypothetical protein C7A17_23495 [Ectopseudomonas mendocina]|jgi:hypothetical protein|uniref:Uncharacterized protein n=1 Tax=Ectopseudomonas mendocina TaxID=300 RepID=A0A2R3QV41_ECTME|nr:hypothetical protein C7A17_23495 [Pseudomonas mendocina]